MKKPTEKEAGRCQNEADSAVYNAEKLLKDW